MMKKTDEIEALDTRAAARVLDIKPGTLARWRWAGRDPAYVRVGRSVKCLREDLVAYLAQRRRDPEAALASGN